MIITKIQKEISVTHTFTILQYLAVFFAILTIVSIVIPQVAIVEAILAVSSVGYVISVLLNDAFSNPN